MLAPVGINHTNIRQFSNHFKMFSFHGPHSLFDRRVGISRQCNSASVLCMQHSNRNEPSHLVNYGGWAWATKPGVHYGAHYRTRPSPNALLVVRYTNGGGGNLFSTANLRKQNKLLKTYP